MKIIFHSYANKPNFHMKSLTLRNTTRRWPNSNLCSMCNISKFSSLLMVWGYFSTCTPKRWGKRSGMALFSGRNLNHKNKDENRNEPTI